MDTIYAFCTILNRKVPILDRQVTILDRQVPILDRQVPILDRKISAHCKIELFSTTLHSHWPC